MAPVTFIAALWPLALLVVLWVSLRHRVARRVHAAPAEPHTGSDGARHGFFRGALFPLVVVAALVALAMPAIARSAISPDWGGMLTCGIVVGVLCLLRVRAGRSGCRAIRLGDDGTCELHLKREVVRLRASQIQSVRYRRGEDGASYRIRFDGGKACVNGEVAGFADFLTRLKSLNPSVDLSSFPADEWPGLAAPGDARKGAVWRNMRGAIFPAGVVILLAWLALETLR